MPYTIMLEWIRQSYGVVVVLILVLIGVVIVSTVVTQIPHLIILAGIPIGYMLGRNYRDAAQKRRQHMGGSEAASAISSAARLTNVAALRLEYPWRRLFTTEAQLDDAFDAVRTSTLRFVESPYKIANMPELAAADLTFMWDGGVGTHGLPHSCSTIISLRPEDYHTTNWMSDWFNERRRLSCRRYDEPESPLQYWAQNKASVIGATERSGPLTYERLNDTMYERVRGCNNFRPGLMRGFVAWLGAKSVLDFSAGWGDRLLGCLAAGVSYVGVDPNPGVHIGYAEMIARFTSDSARYTTITAPFQTAQLPDRTYDLIFTSPPYFDLELYGDDPAQSTVQFSALDEWFEGFLMTSLRKAWQLLDIGGHMVIIINNTRDKPDYVMRMVRAVSALGGAKYLGVISYADRVEQRGRSFYKSPQPMWIWRKDGAGTPQITASEDAASAGSAVSLETLSHAHVDELTAVASDPEVMRTVAAGRPWTRERIIELIEYSDADSRAGNNPQYYHWAIMRAGHVIGYIGLYPLKDRDDGLQIRIFLATTEQGRGYGKAALHELIAIRPAHLSHIYMQMAVDNLASAALAAKLAFKELPGKWSIGGRPMRRFVRDLA